MSSGDGSGSSRSYSSSMEGETVTGSEPDGPTQQRARGLSADCRPVTVPVSRLLKEGTKAAHKAAENVHYVREFVHGRGTREVYRRRVANLYFVDKAMEDALDLNAEHPLIKPVYMPKELHRAAE